MIPIILAVILAFPIPPLGATLGEGTPYHTVVSSTATQTILPATGLATYYSPGVFEQVLRNRGLPADGCADCDGYAAMLWPADMDRVVCVEGLRLWVVDVAAGHHRAELIEKGWIIDIDRASWLVLEFLDTPTMVTVSECEA